MTRTKYFFIGFLSLLICLFYPKLITVVQAAPLQDDAAGTYLDDFANTAGIGSTSGAGINTGVVMLKNSSNTFIAPYNTTGYVATKSLMPLLMAKWGSITFNSNVPANTSINIQIQDDGGTLYPDSLLPGNTTGFSTSPIDISSLTPLLYANDDSSGKSGRIRIKITLNTTDTSVTPTIDNLGLTWTRTQGDLSATTLASSAWPVQEVTQQGTNHTPYFNDKIYPTFKWVSHRYEGTEYVSSSNLLYQNNIIQGVWYVNEDWPSWGIGKFYSYNRITGIDNWSFDGLDDEIKITGENGTGYSTDIVEDAFTAVDLNTGTIKWRYAFGGGHGNEQVLIGSDGTLYTFRVQVFQYCVNWCVGRDAVFYAFNPDGTVKYTKTFNYNNEYIEFNEASIKNDIAYVGLRTDTQDGDDDGDGIFYAINLSDGSTLWQSSNLGAFGFYRPVIDGDGTIYAGNYSYFLNFEKKLYAFNPDGSIKWEKTFGNINGGLSEYSLRSDNVLVVAVSNTNSHETTVYAINPADGSTLWSRLIQGSNWLSQLTTDGSNGNYFLNTLSIGDSYFSSYQYYDKDNNLKWRLGNKYLSSDGTYRYDDYFSNFLIDENGILYSSFIKNTYDLDWNPILTENFYSQSFSLSPWTLTQSSTIRSNLYTGDNMTFTAVTSMGTTNPLFGGDNLVQVYLDTGATFPLSYSHTDSNGNTVWTATYYLPDNTPLGTHTYTVEASQSHLQTDITTHFSSAPTESLNTGITATPQSFNVVPRTQESSPDSNDHTCRDSKPISIPDLFQINTNGNSAKLFFSPVPSMNHYYISFSTKSNAEDHSADVTLAPEGVQNYSITQLKPNTTYYFKVRAQNGCTSGDWSNIFKVNTKSRGVTKTTAFFKKNQPKTNSAASTIIRKTTNYTKKLTNSTPQFINPPKDTLLNPQSNSPVIDTPTTSQTNTPIIQPTPTPKKFCILWWCI